MTSCAPTAGSTCRSRTRCACRVAVRWGSRSDEMAFLVIASGPDSEHGGAVDASQYQLCANLHVAECNWLVTGRADPQDVYVVRAHPHPAESGRHRRDGRVRGRREGQASDGRRTDRPQATHRGARCRSPVRTGVRPALQPVREGVHRPRRRCDHPGPRGGRRRAPRATAHLDGRAVPNAARPLPPRDRSLLLLPAGRYVAGVPAPVPRSCSAIPTPTIRPRWTATTARARRRAGRTSYVSVLRHHASRRGLGRDVRALPAHPRHPGHRSGVRVRPGRGDVRTKSVGAQRFRQHHRDVAAAVVGAEHGEPVDGSRRSLPVRAARPRCWTRCVSSTP